MEANSQHLDQAAAIPYRYRSSRLEICLVTTPKIGHWTTVLRGFLNPGDTASETALRETHKEAGIRGRVFGGSVGYYENVKQKRPLTIAPFLLNVYM